MRPQIPLLDNLYVALSSLFEFIVFAERRSLLYLSQGPVVVIEDYARGLTGFSSACLGSTFTVGFILISRRASLAEYARESPLHP